MNGNTGQFAGFFRQYSGFSLIGLAGCFRFFINIMRYCMGCYRYNAGVYFEFCQDILERIP